MQAGHRFDHRFAGLASDALIFVAPCLRVRVHGGNLAGTALPASRALVLRGSSCVQGFQAPRVYDRGPKPSRRQRR
jgi:hypothetical protein